MGRSVSVPTGAALVCYVPLDIDEDFNFDFEVLLPLRSALLFKFKSLLEADRWIGNEDHVIASNDHADFGVSEYGGLLAVWVIPNKGRGFGEKWVASIEKSFLKLVVATFGSIYKKTATASNGESTYTKEEV